jgi:hypothetical protein
VNALRIAATVAALGLGLAVAGGASAQALQSFTDPAVFFGEDFTLGWEFATSGETVTALGYNDYGFTSGHDVGIWDTSGNLLTSTTVTGGSTLINGYRYTAIAPLNLAAGVYIVAGDSGPGADGWIYQANNIVTDASNTYLDSFFGSGGGLNFPGNDTFGGRQYLLVNFLDAPLSGGVPEPGVWALMLTGFAGAGLMLRRRSAKTAAA